MGAKRPRHLDGIAVDDQLLQAVALWVLTAGPHASGDVVQPADGIAAIGSAGHCRAFLGKPQCPTERLGDGDPEDGQTCDNALVSTICLTTGHSGE